MQACRRLSEVPQPSPQATITALSRAHTACQSAILSLYRTLQQEPLHHHTPTSHSHTSQGLGETSKGEGVEAREGHTWACVSEREGDEWCVGLRSSLLAELDCDWYAAQCE